MANEKKSIPLQIAQRVHRLREDSGLSQDELARRIPCHRSQVSQVERGVNNVSVDTIERFATALGVDALSLMQDGPTIARNPREATPLRDRVSRNIYMLRTARGLAQDTLSVSAGLARNYVSILEVRRRNVSVKHLQELAIALGVSLSAFFDPEGPPR